MTMAMIHYCQSERVTQTMLTRMINENEGENSHLSEKKLVLHIQVCSALGQYLKRKVSGIYCTYNLIF